MLKFLPRPQKYSTLKFEIENLMNTKNNDLQDFSLLAFWVVQISSKITFRNIFKSQKRCTFFLGAQSKKIIHPLWWIKFLYLFYQGSNLLIIIKALRICYYNQKKLCYHKESIPSILNLMFNYHYDLKIREIWETPWFC